MHYFRLYIFFCNRESRYIYLEEVYMYILRYLPLYYFNCVRFFFCGYNCYEYYIWLSSHKRLHSYDLYKICLHVASSCVCVRLKLLYNFWKGMFPHHDSYLLNLNLYAVSASGYVDNLKALSVGCRAYSQDQNRYIFNEQHWRHNW